jgi:hypothetical protein
VRYNWVVFCLLLLVVSVSACSQPAVPPVSPIVTVVRYQAPATPTQALAPTNVVVPSLTPTPPAISPTPRPTDPPAPTPRRVSFATGQINTSVQGALPKNGMDKWVLRIMGGQTLNVNLIPTNGKAKFSIVGADGYPLITDHADAMQWNNSVPATQDYTITVMAFEDTAPSYSLQITVPPLQSAPVQPTLVPVNKRISFAPGAIGATVNGVTPAVDVDRWVIAAMVNQTMSVNLVVPPGGRVALVIYGADGTVLISDHASAMQWSGLLPKTQDYHIDVKPENGVVSYTMQVTIPPK